MFEVLGLRLRGFGAGVQVSGLGFEVSGLGFKEDICEVKLQMEVKVKIKVTRPGND